MITKYQIFKIERVVNGAHQEERGVNFISIGNPAGGKMNVEEFNSYEEAKLWIEKELKPYSINEYYSILEVFSV